MSQIKRGFTAGYVRHAVIKPVLLIDVVILVVSCVLITYFDKRWLQPVLLGYSVFIIPSAFFYWRALRFSAAKDIQKSVLTLYSAEIGKFLLTVGLFAYSFIVMADKKHFIGLFFIAYISLLLVHHLLVAIIANRKVNVK